MTRAALLMAVVFAAPVLAGCLSGSSESALDADGDDRVDGTLGAGLTTYLRNLSEPIEGFDVLDAAVEHFRPAMRDGIELDVWIARPPVEDPVPIVLEITPYYGGGPIVSADRHSIGADGATLVERGFAYGIVSVRGTGNSDGCFTQGGPTEALDSAAVIEFLASQPWSNGNVGLIGVSYPGTTPQDVWVEAPPSLKTIVPISGISDMYKYNFVNGVHINPQGFAFNTYYVPYTAVTGPNGVTDVASVPGAIAGEVCPDQVFVQEGGVSSAADGNKDAYWLVRDFHRELRADWDEPRASVFYIHGLQDWNVKPHMMEDWLPAIQETGVPYKVWIGQWTHNWPQRDDWWNATMIAWFDEFLKEKDTGILDAPPVQVQDDDGIWRHEEHWPPLDVDHVVLYPNDDGSLSPNVTGTGSASYHDYHGGLVPETADLGPARAVWTSEPFKENATISGLPVFEANVTASGSRASLILTLAEVLPSGELRAFNFAAQSLNHVQDLTQGKADISGETQHVTVRFFPQDDVVHAGNRLALVAAGNTAGGPGPSLQPVSDGSTIRIDMDGARLVLPVDMTRSVEDPQPCWDDDTGEPDRCYSYPDYTE